MTQTHRVKMAFGALSGVPPWLFILCLPAGIVLLKKMFPRQYGKAMKKFNACLINILMPYVHSKCTRQKNELFKNFLHKSESSKNVPHVLEVGVGSGSNMSFLPTPCRLSCVDPNLENQSYVMKRLKTFPTIQLDKFVGCFAEKMGELEDNTYDAVVCTFVLCSVRDMDKALSEIKRVLKPGGSFVFMEHVAAPQSSPIRTVQDWLQLMWPTVCDGCNLTCDTGSNVEKAGFSQVQVNPFVMEGAIMFTFVKYGVYGVAVK